MKKAHSAGARVGESDKAQNSGMGTLGVSAAQRGNKNFKNKDNGH